MVMVSETQESFENGAIDSEFYGHQSDEQFQKSVATLKNFDILKSGALQKRTGFRRIGKVDVVPSVRYTVTNGLVVEAPSPELLQKAQASFLWETLEFGEYPLETGTLRRDVFLLKVLKLTIPTTATYLGVAGLAEKYERYFVVGEVVSSSSELVSQGFLDRFQIETELKMGEEGLPAPRISGLLVETRRKVTLREVSFFLSNQELLVFLKEKIRDELFPIWPIAIGTTIHRNRVYTYGQDRAGSQFELRRVALNSGEFNPFITFHADSEVYRTASTAYKTNAAYGSVMTELTVVSDAVVETKRYTSARSATDLNQSFLDPTTQPGFEEGVDLTLNEYVENYRGVNDYFVDSFEGDLRGNNLWDSLFRIGRRIRTTLELGGKEDRTSDIYERGSLFEGQGAFFMGRFLLEEKAGTKDDKDILFRIMRMPRTSEDSNDTAYLLCPAIQQTEMVEGKNVVVKSPYNDFAMGSRYANNEQLVIEWLESLSSQSLYSFSHLNFVEGFPAGAQEYNGRLFYATREFVLASALGVHAGLNAYLPVQLTISADDRKRIQNDKIGDGDISSVAIQRGSDSTVDEVYFRIVEIAALKDEPRNYYPYRKRVAGDGLDHAGTTQHILWIERIRGLMVGTANSEALSRDIRGSEMTTDISFTQEQSFRGSASHLTARGDYALFFVGNDRKTIWQVFYDDGVSGFRSADATFFFGLPDEVVSMVWDAKRRALFALSGGRIFAFYLQREYEIAGWSEWTNVFTQMGNIQALTEVQGSLGFYAKEPIDNTLGLYLFQEFKSKDPEDYKDVRVGAEIEDLPIQSEVEFFKIPMRGETGKSAPYIKSVGYTTLLTQNMTEFMVGDREKFLLRPSPLPVQTKDLSIYVKGQNTVLPTLKVTHTKAERARILSTSSRIDVKEK